MKKLLFLLGVMTLSHFTSRAYSVLTHEAIIDASWKSAIEPLLVEKFPGATVTGLAEAHAYAYGGSVIPDIGYYPFGSKLFTNLVHNVRTGDFVMALIEEARDLNEYAFALGVLSHYMADNYGHSIATNVVVPITFSQIRSKFGKVVTYADHKKSHSRIEFGFDLMQMARENYASMAYRDFIGFKVSKPVLERAFLNTYGLPIDDVFTSISVALVSFRWSVMTLFPTVVKAALINRKDEITNNPFEISHGFASEIREKIRLHHFDHDYGNTGIAATLLSAILPVLPKVGPLSKLRFRKLSQEAEHLFVRSFNTTLNEYAGALNAIQAGELDLPNQVLDTGNEAVAGEYTIADVNWDALLLRLRDTNYEHLTEPVKRSIISYYSSRAMLPSGRKSRKKKPDIRTAVNMLIEAPVKEAAVLTLDDGVKLVNE